MELLRAGIVAAVAAADLATAGIQEEVKVYRFIADADGLGTPKLDDDGVETHQAMVQRREGVLERDGTQPRFRAVVTFLRPTAFGPRDRIRLVDGMTGPVLTPQGGLQDPDAAAQAQTFLRTVYLGGGA